MKKKKGPVTGALAALLAADASFFAVIYTLDKYSAADKPPGFKPDFILSLCELIMGSRNGIEAILLPKAGHGDH